MAFLSLEKRETDIRRIVLVPRNANRLCLPADWVSDKLQYWNPENSLTYGTPWRCYNFGVAEHRTNVGTTVRYHPLGNYGNELTLLRSGTIMFGGSCNWVLNKLIHKFTYEYILDNDDASSEWILLEVWLPDTVTNIKLYYWDYGGNVYTEFADYATPSCSQCKAADQSLRHTAIYTMGFLEETKARLASSEGTPTSPSTVTYSGSRGIMTRFAYAINLAADDGDSSGPDGADEVRLKVEVYYSDSGNATFEFQNVAFAAYGLQNVNEQWMAMYTSGVSDMELVTFDRRPILLYVRADDDDNINQVDLTIPRGNIYWGWLHDSDVTVDDDSNGVPDNFEVDLPFMPSIVIRKDYV